MEKTKNGLSMNKALMVGSALISLNALSIANAQAATGTGAMSAIILTPIVVSGTQALHFGAMTEGGAGGTMIMDTAGARTPGGGVTSVAANTGQSGVISLSGSTGVNIQLSMAAATYTVDDAGAGVAMNVNGWNIRTNAGGATETVSMAASPTTYPLGATLTVGAAQVAGTYTGTYTVNANYQ